MINLLVRGVLSIVSYGAIIFFLAGRIDYWQGWGLLAIFAAMIIALLIIFKDNMELLQERRKPGPGTPWWDKLFTDLFGIFTLAIIVIGCLDAGRFGWSQSLPLWLYLLCYPLITLAFVLFLWSMKVNRFFSSVVRIQEDRGHQVITTGPYRYVRHPGYVGGLIAVPCLALILGSLWALIPACAMCLVFLIRTPLEDRLLHQNLPGYAEYAQNVRYRLIPGLW